MTDEEIFAVLNAGGETESVAIADGEIYSNILSVKLSSAFRSWPCLLSLAVRVGPLHFSPQHWQRRIVLAADLRLCKVGVIKDSGGGIIL
jgi:hypothetical protein